MMMDVERGNRGRRRSAIAARSELRALALGIGVEAASAEDWARLDRFLTLGAESGAYRVASSGFEPEAVESTATARCIRQDAARVVRRVVETMEAGQGATAGAGIRVLAWVTALGNDEGRSAACAGVPQVCRTAADLFLFAECVTALRGWGRGLRRAVGNWYRARFADDLAYQVVKCPRRSGWSHRDLLRLAHPTPATREQAAVFRWILGGSDSLGRRTVVREVPGLKSDPASEGVVDVGEGFPRTFRAVTYPGVGELPRLLRGLEEAKRASSAAEVVRLIAEHNLPREAVPANWLGDLSVWEALLHRMPLGTMIRDLGRLTAVSLVKSGSEAAWWIETRLRDPGVLRASGLHPLAFLLARRAYEQGQADSGKVRWAAVPAVVRALDDAFYAAFRNVRPTGRSLLVSLDLSESTRTSFLPGTMVTVREAAAAMALVAVSTETSCLVVGLGISMKDRLAGLPVGAPGLTLLEIHPGMRLDEVLERLDSMPPGVPDCALPIDWAMRHRFPVDAFVTYTDGEVWARDVPPTEALKHYRAESGLAAKSVVVGLAGSEFQLASETDPGTLDVLGFDGETPGVIDGFLRN
jgi:60 kDa SS-A/Ro ribonucleoprotein